MAPLKDLSTLRDQLHAYAGRLLLIEGPGADGLAVRLAKAWGSEVVSVGAVAASNEGAGPEGWLADGAVFADLDVLFWRPGLNLEVVSALRQAAKRRPCAFVWPGSITGSTASYSEPGRRDFYEATLDNTMVLRARPDAYAGDAPCTVEMVGA